MYAIRSYYAIKYESNYFDFLQYSKFSGSEDVLNLILSKNLTAKTPYKAALELCEYIYTNFKYIQGVTNVNSTIEDVWNLKAGVCQDFTNILLQIVRMCGIPARYVSGVITSYSIHYTKLYESIPSQP